MRYGPVLLIKYGLSTKTLSSGLKVGKTINQHGLTNRHHSSDRNFCRTSDTFRNIDFVLVKL